MSVYYLSVRQRFHPIMTGLSILGHRGYELVADLPSIHSICSTQGTPNAPPTQESPHQDLSPSPRGSPLR